MIALLVLLFFPTLPVSGLAQSEQLGQVTFPTSCDPRVQSHFERGMAMLHSYSFREAPKVFAGMIQQDPSCAVAYFGGSIRLVPFRP